MGKSSSPAPDYKGAAEATADANQQANIWTTNANRPNMTTPWGTSSWTATDKLDQAGYDRAMADWQASGGDPKKRPSQNDYYLKDYTNNVTLSGSQQAALDNQMAIQSGQSDLAKLLQSQVYNTMAGGFTGPSSSTYFNGIPSVNTQFGQFNPTGVGTVNQQSFNPNSYTSGVQGVDQNFATNAQGVNQNSSQFTQGAGNVNQAAPQFNTDNSAAGAKAAFEASTGLMKDQWEQDTNALDSKLRMQGLTPGTEAYNNAMQNQQRVQAQQQNQMANQAVMTGNDMANQNYASALAGFNAGNSAQNQAFGQGMDSFNATNSAQNQQFAQDASKYGMQNDSRNQALQNALAQYQAQITGQGASNEAQQQAYNQALAGYGANQSAQQYENQAIGQAFQQAGNQYNIDYQSALQNYTQGLNNMNAVLNGQQVQMPTFQNFVNSSFTPGADYSGAASATGQWNSAQTAQNNASTGSILGTLGTAAMMFMSDKRLKKNIKRVGTTEAGIPWYSWDWKNGTGSSRGVIAQEVMHVPGAVKKAANGYWMVDYALVA